MTSQVGSGGVNQPVLKAEGEHWWGWTEGIGGLSDVGLEGIGITDALLHRGPFTTQVLVIFSNSFDNTVFKLFLIQIHVAACGFGSQDFRSHHNFIPESA